MVDALDFGFTLCNKACQDQTRRGPQIRCHYRRRRKFIDAAHDRGIAFDFDVGAHALKFLHMHETVFEYGLDNGRGAFRDGV